MMTVTKYLVVFALIFMRISDSSKAQCSVAGCLGCTTVGVCTLCAPQNGPTTGGTACAACQTFTSSQTCKNCTVNGAGLCDPMNCQTGNVYVALQKKCIDCDSNCATCTINGPGLCDTGGCRYGYTKHSSNNCQVNCTTISNCALCPVTNDCTMCNPGFHLSATSPHACIACNTGNCSRCDSTGTCTLCVTGHFLNVNNQCPAQCLPKQNVSNCQTCPSPPGCTQCKANYTLVAGNCIARNDKTSVLLP